MNQPNIHSQPSQTLNSVLEEEQKQSYPNKGDLVNCFSSSVDIQQQAFNAAFTASEKLLELVLHQDEQIRKLLAGCPHIPQEAFLILMKDHSTDVKETLVQRKDCPPEVLLYLAQTNPNQYPILTAILHHPNLTLEVLAALAEVQDFIVRMEAKKQLANNFLGENQNLLSLKSPLNHFSINQEKQPCSINTFSAL